VIFVSVDGAKPVKNLWGVWRTGPHVGWHLADLHTSRRSARDQAHSFKRDGFTDGVVVRRVFLAAPYMNWSRT
jgi:hypothetical protein